jgi:hypothetical protein
MQRVFERTPSRLDAQNGGISALRHVTQRPVDATRFFVGA